MSKIINGDCLEVMKNIPNKSIDMILCDLPYGTTRNKWDSVLPLDILWELYERVIKDNGCIALFSQTPFDKVLGSSNLKLLKYEWIWIKSKPTGHLNAKKAPLKQHENILIFYKKPPIYNCFNLTKVDKMVTRTNKGNYGECSKTTKQEFTGYPRSIVEFNSVSSKEQIHPTQKPIDLLEYLIKTYTNENEIVLDNCMGSGSTIIAAINTNRKYIGIEMDENYFNIAKDRIESHINNANT
jgi:DNA modification methylase